MKQTNIEKLQIVLDHFLNLREKADRWDIEYIHGKGYYAVSDTPVDFHEEGIFLGRNFNEALRAIRPFFG